MPGPKRNRRERTDEWATIQQWMLWRCRRSCTSKSDPSSCFTKPQGSEQRKSMSLSVRCPAKPMNLNAMGWRACSPLGSKAEQEKLARRSHQRCTNSSLTCMLSCPRCQPREIAEMCYIRYAHELRNESYLRSLTSLSHANESRKSLRQRVPALKEVSSSLAAQSTLP